MKDKRTAHERAQFKKRINKTALILGTALTAWGAWLMLGSYTNSPDTFNSGAIITSMGCIIALAAGINLTRSSRRPNGNGAS